MESGVERASASTGSLESEISGLSGGCGCCVMTNGCSHIECSETALCENEEQALEEVLQTASEKAYETAYEKAAQRSQDEESLSQLLFPLGHSHSLTQKA